MMGHREKLRTGDEHDQVSRRWRRLLACFQRAGRGHAVKKGMSRRTRRLSRQALRERQKWGMPG